METPFLISQIVLWLLVLSLAFGYLTLRGKEQKADKLFMQNFGLPIMDAFPRFDTLLIQGEDWKQGNKESKDKIMLFTSATCQSCQGLYPIVTDYAHKNNVDVALFMDGELELIHEKLKENDVKVSVFHFTPDLIDVTKVPVFPYAYYLSSEGIVYNKGGTQREEELDILLNEGRQMEKVMGKAG